MSITENTLYRDSFNFMRNQFKSILLLSLLFAFIATLLTHAISPTISTLPLTQLNSGTTLDPALQGEATAKLLKALSLPLLANMIMVAAFTASIGMVVIMATQGESISALRAIGATTPILPRLFLLTMLMLFLVVLGLMFFVLPGIIVAVLFCLAPVILIQERCGILATLKKSHLLVIANLKLILPLLLLWFISRFLFAMFAIKFLPANEISLMISGTCDNLVSAFALIYLFRLHMLIR